VCLCSGMSNVLSDEKKNQILALGGLGWSLRRIQTQTGVRRETAAGYLRAAGLAVRGRGRPDREWNPKPAIKEGVSTDPVPKPAITREVSTDSEGQKIESPGRAPSASACEPFRDLIEDALCRGRNAMAIYQDLVDDHGFAAKYASVKRFVVKLRGSLPVEARVVIETAPGEEAQVDYGGDGPMVRDARTGRYRRMRLFVMTLGYSRKSVRLIEPRSSTQIWAELHEKAFRRLGGTPRIVVLDNLREGVKKPDIYDPLMNPLYRDVLAHYGVVAVPCQVRDPDRKGKVERAVGHVQRTPLKGLRFESIEAAQRYLDRWEENWADTRIHGTTKRQVSAMFAEEKPSLRGLPVEPFRYYRFGERSVNLDGCVEVEAAYYSAPPGWIGRKVPVQWDESCVRLMDPGTGRLLREHQRTLRGRHRVDEQDRPSRTPPTTLNLLRRARAAGPSIGSLCEEMHRRDGEPGVRRIQGVLNLARKNGAPAVEDAAKVALDAGAPTYRFVRTYLERRPTGPLTLKQVDPLIRQLNLYRDLIDQRTGSPQ
jgi:transposase